MIPMGKERLENVLEYQSPGIARPGFFTRLHGWYESSGEGTTLGMAALAFAFMPFCGAVLALPMGLGALLAPDSRKVFPLAALALVAF